MLLSCTHNFASLNQSGVEINIFFYCATGIFLSTPETSFFILFLLIMLLAFNSYYSDISKFESKMNKIKGIS